MLSELGHCITGPLPSLFSFKLAKGDGHGDGVGDVKGDFSLTELAGASVPYAKVDSAILPYATTVTHTQTNHSTIPPPKLFPTQTISHPNYFLHHAIVCTHSHVPKGSAFATETFR